MDRRLALGVNPICIEAAKEAISGVSNVGDATHFRTLIPGREGIIIGSHVFW